MYDWTTEDSRTKVATWPGSHAVLVMLVVVETGAPVEVVVENSVVLVVTAKDVVPMLVLVEAPVTTVEELKALGNE